MSKLIQMRKALGESQEQAANGIGIAQSMLAMMESGDRRGSDATKTKVANYYGTTVGALFFEDNIASGDIKLPETEATK